MANITSFAHFNLPLSLKLVHWQNVIMYLHFWMSWTNVLTNQLYFTLMALAIVHKWLKIRKGLVCVNNYWGGKLVLFYHGAYTYFIVNFVPPTSQISFQRTSKSSEASSPPPCCGRTHYRPAPPRTPPRCSGTSWSPPPPGPGPCSRGLTSELCHR